MEYLGSRTARFSAKVVCITALLFLVFSGGTSVHAQAQSSSDAIYDAELFAGMEYRMVGPSRGGRVTAVAGHRDQPQTFYMGSTGGGVWKTNDYGHTWRNITDGEGFSTASIGSIRVADSDTNVVYVGTGTDGLRSNVVTGRGVYKSTDAGETWRHMGLRKAGLIGRMVVHPQNPDVAYVAAIGRPYQKNEERGVYRTRDGGESWEKVLYIADSVGVYGLAMHPEDPKVLYAGAWRGERKPWTIISGLPASEGGGIYKSTDGGDNWTKLEKGLPQGLIGKIDLSVSPDNPDRVYALIEAKEPKEGLYRSDDRGETWEQVSDKEGLMERPFYYTNVTADPTDADVVYVNDEGFYKSTDGGENFERVRTPHGDNHNLWINPDDPDIMVQSNDGGANVTLDGGKTWTTQQNQPTAELYQVNVDDQFPYWLYAGQQDNSSIMVPSLPPGDASAAGHQGNWKAIGGCETGPSVPKPGNPNTVYSNCKGRFGLYSHLTGQEKQYYVGAQSLYGSNPAKLDYRFQRTVPIEVDPGDPGTVYYGSQFLHKTTNGGVVWETISPDLTANKPQYQMRSGGPITNDITGEEHYSVLYTIEVSPHDSGVIWTGANDGPVHVTRDGGQSWQDVTPPEMPEDGRIDAIDPSPHQPGKAYIAMHRRLLGDYHPYIYKTEDYGETWTRLADGTNGIPANYPTRVVREDPSREGLLYAGTSFGLSVSFDDGGHWQPFQQNLPVTPVTDIKLYRGDLVLSTMGRGFWIMDNLTPLHQLSDQIASSEAHLFNPRDAYRMRYRVGGSYFGGDDPAEPEYRPPGAMIDYYLDEEPQGTLTLEILDEDEEVIRNFSSEEGGETAEETKEMQAPIRRQEGAPDLPKSAGMHRFVWGMKYPGTWSEEGRKGDGPLATPGNYQVRLTAGDWSQTQPLRLKIDPRVAETGVTVANLREQLQLSLKIRDAVSEARRVAASVDSLQQKVAASEVSTGQAQSASQELGDLETTLMTSKEGSYPRRMLIDQLEYLYGMTTRADQKLGQDAFERYETLRSRLDTLLNDANKAKQKASEAISTN